MHTHSFYCCLLGFLTFLTARADSRLINDGWKFRSGDVPEARYAAYDDAAWRSLRLPHDWAFENGYSADGAQGDKGGYAGGGIGWYRRELRLTPAERQAQKVFLDFDAAYMNSEVWFNGHYLGKRPYGYISFSYEVTPYLKPDRNVISVRIDNSLEPSARWYHGCGIYGDVHLRTHGEAYFERHATFIRRSTARGEVEFSTLVRTSGQSGRYGWEAEIFDARGHSVARHSGEPVAATPKGDSLAGRLKVRKPSLWSPEHPVLYTLRLRLLSSGGKVVAEERHRIGFRDFRWETDRGFFLNGKSYKLRGMSEHLEGGPVGACYTPQLLRWKLGLLKEMGCNAVRTAHNPQLPVFYDLCDEMGLLVMDEAFDGWSRKAEHDYGQQAFAAWWERDLRAFIRRDRNHPCVFLYSVGNETEGKIAADLVRVCHEEDPTRLVTSGSAASDAMDIVGMNGGSETRQFLSTYRPDTRPFVATENPHTWQVRGFYRSRTWYRDGYRENYQHDIPNLTATEIFTYDWCNPERRSPKQVFNSSYDNATVRATSRHILEVQRDCDWFSGSFRWTGFDYLGEAGYVHGGWPFRAFQSGALDLAGFPKDLYYLYQSEWTDKDMVHLLPHWTHPRMQPGTLIPVWAYTTGDEVELFLNGRSLGVRRKGRRWDQMQCEFMVPWQPGRLEAVARRRGREIARAVQTTAGAPARFSVTVENDSLKNDGVDISILTVRQEDVAGTLSPYADNRIFVALNGPARVLSFENGNPVDTERNFAASSRRCFFGLNRLFIQSVEAAEAPVSVLLSAICGDRQLQQSSEVSIVTTEVVLRGARPQRHLRIHYTTDGTFPTPASPRYEGPFRVVEGTEVRAAVYDGARCLQQLSERFGREEGLFWPAAAKE